MTTHPTRTPARAVRARLAAALRRLPAAADAYTLHHFNPQHELRGRR